MYCEFFEYEFLTKNLNKLLTIFFHNRLYRI